MTLVKNNRFNLIMGSVLTILVTLPTFVIGDAKDSSFLPHNAWLWPSLLILLICGLLFSLFSLMNKVHWGFFLWSQSILSLRQMWHWFKAYKTRSEQSWEAVL